MNNRIVRVKYFSDKIKQLKKISDGDWLDLRSARRYDLKKGECAVIDLGVGMILPEGYEAHIVPRSSTALKFGLISLNSIGIIDNSYSGEFDEWKFPVMAVRDTVIEVNDRICQFRIVKNQPDFTIEEVQHLNERSRGGLGSTGWK